MIEDRTGLGCVQAPVTELYASERSAEPEPIARAAFRPAAAAGRVTLGSGLLVDGGVSIARGSCLFGFT